MGGRWSSTSAVTWPARSAKCSHRFWLGRKPLSRCPDCGGSLFDSEARRQQWYRGFGTRREAERARTELLGRLDTGAYVSPTKQTLAHFLIDDWLPAKETTLKPSTLTAYRMYCRVYIKGSGIGSVPLAQVDGPRLTAFYADLLVNGRRQAEGGLSAKTVRNIHGMLHKALADAIRWGRAVRNAADAADQPRKSTPEMKVWTPEEMRSFLEHVCDDRHFAAWQLLATTGMRRASSSACAGPTSISSAARSPSGKSAPPSTTPSRPALPRPTREAGRSPSTPRPLLPCARIGCARTRSAWPGAAPGRRRASSSSVPPAPPSTPSGSPSGSRNTSAAPDSPESGFTMSGIPMRPP